MKTRFYLDGVEISEPINYAELSIELNFDKNSNNAAVSINEWEFGVEDKRLANDGAVQIKNHASGGLNGGVGVFEGKPFKIILDGENGKSYTLFDGYVDVSKAQFDNGIITAPATEQGKIDWLNDVADSFSFEYLESIGKISNSDYMPVPYCINKKQNAIEIIMTLVTIFVIVDKLQENITNITEKQPEVAGVFTTVPAIIGLVVRIAYIIVLLVALVGLVSKMILFLVQPVKYHYGMYAKDLIRIGLNHLGLKFQSSILQSLPFSDLVIIPEKYNLKENKGIFEGISGLISPSNESSGYFKGTFGDLFRHLISMFKAKILIENGTLYFEKFNYSVAKATYILPDVLDSRYRYEYNYEDLKSTYIISFSIDSGDRNTIQEYKGTSVQITQQPIAVSNRKMLLFRNLEEVRIPFALAKRKKELNFVEKLLGLFFDAIQPIINLLVSVTNLIIKAINAIISLLNKVFKVLRLLGIKIRIQIPSVPALQVPSFRSQLENRVGMMVLESDYVNVPKMLLVKKNGTPKNNKILDSNELFLSGKYLWDNYHYYASFVPKKDSPGNQYLLKNIEEIPFTFSDFESVRTNNIICDPAGKEAELITLKFNPDKQTATGRYKVRELYTKNIQETIIEPDGK